MHRNSSLPIFLMLHSLVSRWGSGASYSGSLSNSCDELAGYSRIFDCVAAFIYLKQADLNFAELEK